MKKLLFCFFVLMFTSPAFTATIYVPAGQPTIQAGINAAIGGDTISISIGYYFGSGNRDIWVDKALTIVGEGGPQLTVIDAQADSLSQSRVFIINAGSDNLVVLKDLTIKGGFVFWEHFALGQYGGGGILCADSTSLILDNCVVSNCFVADGGAGMYCGRSSDIQIYRSSFRYNEIWDGCCQGGAIYMYNGELMVSESIFENNFAGYGSAISVWDSTTATIYNSTFRYNHTLKNGAITGRTASHILISNSEIYGNVAHYYHASGIHVANSSTLEIENCTITENTAEVGHGFPSTAGAVHVSRGSRATISGTLIADNDNAGIVTNFSEGVNISISSSTIARQRQTLKGNGSGIVISEQDSLSVDSCIIAFNDSIGIAGDGQIDVSCTDIFGNAAGDWVGLLTEHLGVLGNISIDPSFCDIDDRNYHLLPSSPCVPDNNSCNVLMGVRDVGCECCRNRGDYDHNGDVDIFDLTSLIDYLFRGGVVPDCDQEADIDGSGSIDITDLTYFVDYMFRNGPPPGEC